MKKLSLRGLHSVMYGERHQADKRVSDWIKSCSQFVIFAPKFAYTTWEQLLDYTYEDLCKMGLPSSAALPLSKIIAALKEESLMRVAAERERREACSLNFDADTLAVPFELIERRPTFSYNNRAYMAERAVTLEELFQELDPNKTGLIGEAELSIALRRYGVVDHEQGVKAWFQDVDKTHRGALDQQEFVEFMTYAHDMIFKVSKSINPHVWEESGELEPTVFLGGSCNPTTWRQDIVIPLLKKASISYFNPQVDEWHEGLVALEARAKSQASLLFFVIDSLTLSLASMIECCELITSGRPVVLVINDLPPEATLANGDSIPAQVRKDANRARAYMADVAVRHHIIPFSSISRAACEVIQFLHGGWTGGFEFGRSRSPTQARVSEDSWATLRMRMEQGSKLARKFGTHLGSPRPTPLVYTTVPSDALIDIPRPVAVSPSSSNSSSAGGGSGNSSSSNSSSSNSSSSNSSSSNSNSNSNNAGGGVPSPHSRDSYSSGGAGRESFTSVFVGRDSYTGPFSPTARRESLTGTCAPSPTGRDSVSSPTAGRDSYASSRDSYVSARDSYTSGVNVVTNERRPVPASVATGGSRDVEVERKRHTSTTSRDSMGGLVGRDSQTEGPAKTVPSGKHSSPPFRPQPPPERSASPPGNDDGSNRGSPLRGPIKTSRSKTDGKRESTVLATPPLAPLPETALPDRRASSPFSWFRTGTSPPPSAKSQSKTKERKSVIWPTPLDLTKQETQVRESRYSDSSVGRGSLDESRSSLSRSSGERPSASELGTSPPASSPFFGVRHVLFPAKKEDDGSMKGKGRQDGEAQSGGDGSVKGSGHPSPPPPPPPPTSSPPDLPSPILGAIRDRKTAHKSTSVSWGPERLSLLSSRFSDGSVVAIDSNEPSPTSESLDALPYSFPPPPTSPTEVHYFYKSNSPPHTTVPGTLVNSPSNSQYTTGLPADNGSVTETAPHPSASPPPAPLSKNPPPAPPPPAAGFTSFDSQLASTSLAY